MKSLDASSILQLPRTDRGGTNKVDIPSVLVWHLRILWLLPDDMGVRMVRILDLSGISVRELIM